MEKHSVDVIELLFSGPFGHFWIELYFCGTRGTKIGSKPKNKPPCMSKFNQVDLVQIRQTLYMFEVRYISWVFLFLKNDLVSTSPKVSHTQYYTLSLSLCKIITFKAFGMRKRNKIRSNLKFTKRIEENS